MTELLDFGARNWMFWSGVGGLAVPLLCYSLRWLGKRIPGMNGGATTPIVTPDSPTDTDRDANRPAPTPEHVDQLQGIEGIGPKIAELLVANGLDSFSKLAGTEVAKIQSILDKAGFKYDLAVPATWPAQAQFLADGDIESFLKLAITLTAGVTVLENITGIGSALGERLRYGGINTVKALSMASEEDVREALGDDHHALAADIPGWIAQAECFAAGNRLALAELAGNLQRATMPSAAADILAGPARTPSPTDTASCGETPTSTGDGGRAGIPSLVPDAGGGAPSGPWVGEKAALACTAGLGSLLLIGSFAFPPPRPRLIEHRFERDCMLNGRTTFPESALFEKGQTTLTVEGIQVVKKYVDDRKREAVIRKDKPDKILVVGFASDEGTEDYNKALSERRARTISERLETELGWARTLFTHAGKGESEARACYLESRATREACRVSDRKIEVLVAYGAIDPASAQRTCGDWRKINLPKPSRL
ncbi:MAG: OmpA family protein [Sphingobium sp.]|uniref:OmpA family protein n=1 Tax=Sphingobium sp. TaxID=1912891 RepID=UPI0029B8362B|nr:OmpA family protein [Sphingobium sp.]MDX3911715.1 OmpA family protein [Sphingobium sp.]